MPKNFSPLNKNQVAVFPLPGMVAFEGQQHLLHIFEPRYRKMVEDCVSEGIPLGLALAKKKISSVDNSGKSFQEILSSNQNTYEAHRIFGAGPVRILRTLPDGRILTMVQIYHRVQLEKLVQSLPYFLAEVIYLDSFVGEPNRGGYYFDQLINVSRLILGDKYRLFEEKVPDQILIERDLQALMLKIMDWFRLESGMLQLLLEERLVEDRAQQFLGYMQQYIEGLRGPIGAGASLDQEKGSKADSERKGSDDGKVIQIDFQGRTSPPEK